jgi:arsenite oxidase small subunit
MDRRVFLKLSSIGVGTVALSTGAVIVGTVRSLPADAAGRIATKAIFDYPDYPDVVVANVGDLKPGEPIFFDYPQEGQRNMLVKLGKPAEEGVGPDQDIVAFSSFCSHMGAPLDNVFNAEHGIVGPCPLHFSTFDLSKSGRLVMGKATESLPQVVLEVNDAGEITAKGMYGLIYGYAANLAEQEVGA